MKKSILFTFDFTQKSIIVRDLEFYAQRGDDFTLCSWSDLTDDKELVNQIERIIFDGSRILVLFTNHILSKDEYQFQINIALDINVEEGTA